MKLFLEQASEEDRAAERETLQTSREGLDSLYLDLQTRLKEETQTRLVSVERVRYFSNIKLKVAPMQYLTFEPTMYSQLFLLNHVSQIPAPAWY